MSMAVEFNSSSLEARVLRLLQEAYPITLKEMRRKLRVPPAKLDRVLKALSVQGFVRLQKLPDKTYVELVSRNFRFTGRNPTQRKRLKHKKGQKKKKEVGEYDGPMFG